MNAELVVVSGQESGRRLALDPGQACAIGRAPASALRTGAGAEWRHAVVSYESGSWWLVDVSTAGTFVNGARAARRKLEDADQIRVGGEVLLFRAANPAQAEAAGVRPVLMTASVLTFLFRALGQCEGQPGARELEAQILRLVGDLIPVERGCILAGPPQDCPAAPPSFLAALAEQGPQWDAVDRLAGVPIYAQGSCWGVLIVHLMPQARPADCLDILTSIATLAGMGLETAREVETLRAANEVLVETLKLDTEVVGHSAPIRRLLELVERVAPRETTVLILGESGTGKELIARTVHRNSARRAGPFVAINCAALTETLLESELFGHEKGAFTGATAQKKGKLESADHGTVFLDEIGELAPGLQAKLLRVLQQREFERVGSTETRRLNVRIVAATNRDLATEVRAGRFREDLFHRLNVVTLRTPALRERPDDILPLGRHFLTKAAAESGRVVRGFSAGAEDCLRNYDWPGNVRELENAVERAVVLGISDEILPEDLPDSVLESAAAHAPSAYQMSLVDAKRESILRAYEQSGGDYKGAAKILGLHPNYLLRLVRNLGLRDSLRARPR